MKPSKTLSISFAITIGVAAGLCSGLPTGLQADDTEIYLGGAAVSAGIRPNVLFILDTSGSMSATVAGTGMDRLDNMKVAIKKILDGANNINVGLMRFSDPGGPILYPVSYIDEDVSVVSTDPAAADINVRIDQGIDDAEQIDCNVVAGLWDCGVATNPDIGKVSLNSPVLDMMRTAGAPSAGGNTFDTLVTLSSDDAEQYTDGTQANLLTGNNFGLGYDDNRPQANGMRFRNVEIPPGATILSAEIEFTARSNNSAIGFTLQIREIGRAHV